MKTLMITPHLDDIFIGAGGTILKMINQGDNIEILELFDSIESKKHFNFKNVKVRRLKGMDLDHSSILRLSRAIEEAAPEKVFLSINGSHLDHLKAYELGSRALQISTKNLADKEIGIDSLFIFENVESLINNLSSPQEVYIDISKEFKNKIKILKKFKKINKFSKDFIKQVEYLNKIRGWQSSTKYAELFLKVSLNKSGDIFDSIFENKLIIDDHKKSYKNLP